MIPEPTLQDLAMNGFAQYDLAAALGDSEVLARTIAAWIRRAAHAEAKVAELTNGLEKLNQMLRQTGYGQGQIDSYVAECEGREAAEASVAELTKENERLREQYQTLLSANEAVQRNKEKSSSYLDGQDGCFQ